VAVSRKRWKIRPRLLLITDRNWRIDFQMTWTTCKSVQRPELYRLFSASSLARRFIVRKICETYVRYLRCLFLRLDATLWPGVCKHFAGKHFFYQDDSLCTSLRIYSSVENRKKIIFWVLCGQHNHWTKTLWKMCGKS